MKVSWNTADGWHCESPRVATGESESSVAVEGPILKGSWRKAEVWQNVVESKSLKKPGEATGDGVTLVAVETPECWRYQNCGLTTKDSSRCVVEPP